MNLREAAARTLRSITTLRRYIRSGRLRAEKHPGRYGPEYFVYGKDLLDAGLSLEREEAAPAEQALEKPAPSSPARSDAESVQLHLYQELQMKHEQLLVQYGMVRAGGMRAMELRHELEASRHRVDELNGEVERLRRKLDEIKHSARKANQEAELELQGRALEIAALTEKVRGLEMLMRNAVTSESLDQQVASLMGQAQRVGRKGSEADGGAERLSWQGPKPRKQPGDH